MSDEKKRALFLDRDGTLIVDQDYLADPAGVELFPGVAGALKMATEAGFLLVVVSNQSGVGRGYFTDADVVRVNERLFELLVAEGVVIDAFYHCPHAPEDGCNCRKPETGMVEKAAADLGIDTAASFVIGDKASDIELGRRTGAGTVLVSTGKKGEDAPNMAIEADYRADTFAEAIGWIINET